MTVVLYTRETLAELRWPETENGRYAKDYLAPLIESGPEYFVNNVRTTYGLVLIDDSVVLPVSFNVKEYDNSYVCSPYAHYVTYAKEELRVLKNRAMRSALSGALSSLGTLCRFTHVNQIVLVNNWLLSTNLYPALTADQVAEVTTYLSDRFPGHAIGFCSVNSGLTAACSAAGCMLVPGRQIAVARPAEHSAKHRRRWRRDLLLVNRRGYQVVEPTLDDADRIVELYNQLYLDKYSRNNQQFNKRFIRETMRSGTITYVALTLDGRIDGVLGYFVRDGVMTTPIFGYDTTIPQQTGLYRMLGGILYDLAAQKGWLLNDSSGAAEFKRLRGAVPEIEYRAVYVRHLPWRRRVGWATLSFMLRQVAVPIVRRYGL